MKKNKEKLVKIEKEGDVYTPGRMIRANEVDSYKAAENGDWKFLNFDNNTGGLVSPMGTTGYRWQDEKGKWNLNFNDGETGKEYDPTLSLLEKNQPLIHIFFHLIYFFIIKTNSHNNRNV